MSERLRTILADDLTGAADAGLQFAKCGLRTIVWLDGATLHEAPDCDVLVADMDSRAATPALAYARMHALVARARRMTPSAVVKKMDSTLRGNIGPELLALLEAMPGAFAIVCPAFPKQGRTCRDGVLYVHGTPVDETDLAHDLFSPVTDARIGAQVASPHAPLPLDVIRAGAAAINERIERLRQAGIRIAAADAETDDDLRTLAALQHVRNDVLWVGSAGLIEALCHPDVLSAAAEPVERRANCHPEPVEGCATIEPVEGRATIAIVGSINDMTRRQIAAFAAHPEHHVEMIAPAPLLDNAASIAKAIARATTAVAQGTDTMIALDGRDVEAALALGRARGWDVHETSRRIREALVATADSLIDSAAGGTVVLSGGDVARAFCDRRGIRGLELLAEVAPGIPVSRAIGANLLVVTKAGGFGHAEAYRDVIAALRTKAFTA